MHLSLRRSVLVISIGTLLSGIPAGKTCAQVQDTTTVTHNQAAPADEQWQELQQDKIFGYAQEKEFREAPKKTASSKPNAFIRLLQAIMELLSGFLGIALLWLLIFGIVGYIIYQIAIGDKSFIFGKTKKTLLTESTEQTDDELMETDWEQRLRKAYEQGDLRLAIRYSYMWLLRMMQERELILYQNDKTNNDYYHELAETAYKQPFRRLSREYEFAWYGGYAVSDAAYKEYMQLFNTIKTQLH